MSESVMRIHCRYETNDVPLRPGCALGIDVRRLVGGSDFGWLRRHPCYFKNRDQPGFVPCEKAEPHTEEEIEQHEREVDLAVDRLLARLPLIEQLKSEHRGKNWSGSIVCPECGGTLNLSHAASNGHVSGRCSTEGCLAWME